MPRLTRKLDNGKVFIVNEDKVIHEVEGYSGDAINKLAKFEDIYDDIIANQSEISKELEKLRNEGKTHSVKFKELLVKKLTNSNILSIFETYLN